MLAQGKVLSLDVRSITFTLSEYSYNYRTNRILYTLNLLSIELLDLITEARPRSEINICKLNNN